MFTVCNSQQVDDPKEFSEAFISRFSCTLIADCIVYLHAFSRLKEIMLPSIWFNTNKIKEALAFVKLPYQSTSDGVSHPYSPSANQKCFCC